MVREISDKKPLPLSICKEKRLVYSPTFDFHALLFRPLPVPIDNLDTLSPYYDPNDETKPGPWLLKDVLIADLTYFNKFTRIVLRHSSEYESDEVLNSSPIYHVYRFVSPYIRYIRDPSITPKLILDQNTLTYISSSQFTLDVYSADLIQSIIYVYKSSIVRKPPGLGHGNPAALVLLKRRAREAFLSTLYDDSTGDLIDLVSLDRGKLVRICRLGTDTHSPYPTTGSDQGASYKVNLFDEYDRGRFKASLAGQEDNVLPNVADWKTLLLLPDEKEQLTILEGTDIPRVIIAKALQDKFDIPDSIYKAAKREEIKIEPAKTVNEPDDSIEEEPFDDQDVANFLKMKPRQ